MKSVEGRRFHDLNRVPISVRLGSFRADILYWGYYDTKWWRNYLHTHSFFEICIAHEGVGTYLINGVKHKVRRGDLFIARPNEPHEIISDRKQPLGIYFWAFSLTDEKREAAESSGKESIDSLLRNFMSSTQCISRSRSMAVEQTCRTLVSEIAEPRPGYTRAIESLIVKLLLDTARAVENSGTPERIVTSADSDAKAVVETIQSYLHDNLARQIGVRDLAAQVQMSQRHVSRIFKVVTGKSVGHYLIDLRIAAAEQKLRNRSLPIKQIAAAVGYPDTRYFTTLFGKKTGMTPAEFRRNGGTRFLRRRK